MVEESSPSEEATRGEHEAGGSPERVHTVVVKSLGPRPKAVARVLRRELPRHDVDRIMDQLPAVALGRVGYARAEAVRMSLVAKGAEVEVRTDVPPRGPASKTAPAADGAPPAVQDWTRPSAWGIAGWVVLALVAVGVGLSASVSCEFAQTCRTFSPVLPIAVGTVVLVAVFFHGRLTVWPGIIAAVLGGSLVLVGGLAAWARARVGGPVGSADCGNVFTFLAGQFSVPCRALVRTVTVSGLSSRTGISALAAGVLAAVVAVAGAWHRPWSPRVRGATVAVGGATVIALLIASSPRRLVDAGFGPSGAHLGTAAGQVVFVDGQPGFGWAVVGGVLILAGGMWLAAFNRGWSRAGDPPSERSP